MGAHRDSTRKERAADDLSCFLPVWLFSGGGELFFTLCVFFTVVGGGRLGGGEREVKRVCFF